MPTRICIVQVTVFPVVIYGCESWTIKKAEHWRADAFELWCLRVPWAAWRSNQSILKGINSVLEGLTLKLKLQYYGHLMWRADLLEKTLMLGKIKGRRRKGQRRMRWLDGITDSIDMTLSKLLEMVKDREKWRAEVHGVGKRWTWPSEWATTKTYVWAPLVAQKVKNLPVVRETWIWFLGQEDPLEKRMTIHSSVPAWRIPWTGEACGLQSMGSQRVGHNWVWLTLSLSFTFNKSWPLFWYLLKYFKKSSIASYFAFFFFG